MEKQHGFVSIKKIILIIIFFMVVLSIIIVQMLEDKHINEKLAKNLYSNLKRSFVNYGLNTEVEGIVVHLSDFRLKIEQLSLQKNNIPSLHRFDFVESIRLSNCDIELIPTVFKLELSLVCQAAHISTSDFKFKSIVEIDKKIITNLTFDSDLWKAIYNKHRYIRFKFNIKNLFYNQNIFAESTNIIYDFIDKNKFMLNINHNQANTLMVFMSKPDSIAIDYSTLATNEELFVLNENVKNLTLSLLNQPY